MSVMSPELSAPVAPLVRKPFFQHKRTHRPFRTLDDWDKHRDTWCLPIPGGFDKAMGLMDAGAVVLRNAWQTDYMFTGGVLVTFDNSASGVWTRVALSGRTTLIPRLWVDLPGYPGTYAEWMNYVASPKDLHATDWYIWTSAPEYPEERYNG